MPSNVVSYFGIWVIWEICGLGAVVFQDQCSSLNGSVQNGKAVCILHWVQVPNGSLRGVWQGFIHYFKGFYFNDVLLGYFKWLAVLF